MERDPLALLVAENIEQMMKQRNLDAAKLARRAGLNPTGVYDILKGKSRSPKLETIARIAEGLAVPVSALLSRDLEEALSPSSREELLSIYERLSPEGRNYLIQAARSWLAETSSKV